jgi:DNA-binding CsgD family transcriptional regulator/tetratricopeptide (TPR) repeat protein
MSLSKQAGVPRSGAEYKLEQRRHAAAKGLCHTCCAVKVAPGRSTCPKCSADASARTVRRRREVRTKSEMQRGVSALETLGDAYSSDGDYRAALKSYQRAFDLSEGDLCAHARLAVKVGDTAFHRGIATDADGWFNIPLEKTVPVPGTGASVAHLHMQQIRTLWASSRTADIVPLSERLLDFATASNDADLILATRLSLAMVLHLLSRYDEAERYLRAISIRALPKDPKMISKYHRVCALVYASSGNAEMASDSFAKALHYAEQDPDPYAYTSILHSHAISASMLGRTELAASLFLQALSAARDRNLGWYVACISLEYARVLSRRGNRHLAHAYVDQAATVENPPPVLLEALAEIGIPIAIECNDPYLLSQCANEEALTFAFRSGQPPRLGPVACSFARYYHRMRQVQKARELLAKALDYVKNADEACDLPIAVAQFGEEHCFGQAREVLRSRTLLPNADVASAHLRYFDALVLDREGDAEGCAREATAAATLFRTLRWTSYELAATLLGASAHRTRSAADGSADPAASIPAELTLREQSVAQLAIVGLSNREIGERLSISARTVECHMTSILRRMGLRSRHQLLESVRR